MVTIISVMSQSTRAWLVAERILGYNVKMGFWQFVPGIYSPFTKSSVQWNFEKSWNLAKLGAIFF